MLLLTLCVIASSAHAHGERALELFVRMRTVQWYDIAWTKSDIKVNDEIVMSGKFHVSEDWPASLPKPDSVYLNVASPSPVLVRKEVILNGVSIVNAVALETGGDYEFLVTLRGRVPGEVPHPSDDECSRCGRDCGAEDNGSRLAARRQTSGTR